LAARELLIGSGRVRSTRAQGRRNGRHRRPRGVKPCGNGQSCWRRIAFQGLSGAYARISKPAVLGWPTETVDLFHAGSNFQFRLVARWQTVALARGTETSDVVLISGFR